MKHEAQVFEIDGHMEYLKSGKGSDWLKYQLSRSQVYLKPTISI